MIQEIYIPQSRELRKIINFLYYVEFNAEHDLKGTTAIFPNATTNLTLVLDSGIDFNQLRMELAIYASCSSTVFMNTQVGCSFIGAQFNNYGMYYLTSIPVDQVQDNLLPLEHFFRQSALQRITEQVKEIESLTERFQKLESFLLEEIDSLDVDPRLPHGVSMFESDPTLKMDDLSNALCLSNRGVQKLFKKYFGMSPAYFKKIKRFNKATQLLLQMPEAPLASIAQQCGYYDQAHFIKDFKHFGNITPSHFLKLQVKSSDFYNQSLQEVNTLAPS